MMLSARPQGAPSARRSIPVAWFVVGLVVAAGVGVAGASAYLALRSAPAPSGPGSVVLTDDLGRNVTVPYDPVRIAVLSANIMDSIYRLGLRGHVVGVDCYLPAFGGLSADYSPDQIALWNLSPSMCIQVAPTFDVEELLNLTPQVVFASTIVSVASVEEITSTYHLPVVMLQPATLSGVMIDDSILGRIFGAGGAAEALNGALTSVLANASALPGEVSAFPTVLVTYSTGTGGYYTFGPGTFGESLIELAGGSSISANATLPYPELSGEQVLAANPDRIVYGVGFGLTVSNYTQAPFWDQLGAVRSGNLTGLNSNWITEPDPTMILDGLPALIAALHPGRT